MEKTADCFMLSW